VVLGSWVFWVIASIVLHELGHGMAAIRSGDRTPIDTGHMTLNPFVHMGAVSLVCFAILGFCWGAMPVDPTRFRGRYDEAKVAAAGPAMNFGLALTCAIAGAVWAVLLSQHAPEHVRHNVRIFIRIGAGLNVFLMLFNLLPVPPLDGSRILANFFPAVRRMVFDERGQIIAVIGFVLVFRFVSGGVQTIAFEAADRVIESATRALEAISGMR